MPYLVRSIKPNLIFSHDWHVQPNCQRSLREIRLSGSLLDRGPTFRLSCPRTCCAAIQCEDHINRRFCANLLNISELLHPVKLQSFSSPRPSNSLLAVYPRLRIPISLAGDSPVQKPRTAHNIKQQPAQSAPETLASHRMLLPINRKCSRVLQWLVLCGIPYSGFRGYCLTRPNEPALQPLPTSLIGAGHKATGRLYRSSATF